MCGIIGYTGKKAAAPVLLEGLSSLEYRGYDSAGIAVLDSSGEFRLHKSLGKLSNLRESLGTGLPNGISGLGHTRWATHGGPTDYNAHPHTDCNNDTVVVHNGIVENYMDLKRELLADGHTFTSETDTECIPHLIESFLKQNMALDEAVRQTSTHLKGANAVVVMSRQEPNQLVAFRIGNAGGIVIGYGEMEMLLASDLPPLLTHTRQVVYLDGGEIVTVTAEEARYNLLDGTSIKKPLSEVPYDAVSTSKGKYRHFMIKEIAEQPNTVIDTLRGRVSFDPPTIELDDFPFSDEEINGFERVVLLGMGTSLHTAIVGRTWMESIANIASEVDNSSEFRYREPIINNKTLVVSISQSGETADTLAAMEEASRKGASQITLCNYDGTQTTRIADATVLIRAGLEIGVAASKTFVCSLTSLYLLTLHMAIQRGTLNKKRIREIVDELGRLPHMLGTLLTNQKQYELLAQNYSNCSDFLFLGRGINYPLAMEGALKLKEISYIHAEGYPAGEMKHGPISLIDENMPVVALIPKDNLYEKMLNNINEAKARGGIVIAVATEGDTEIVDKADHVIFIPKASPLINPILMATPMQLLAYNIAVQRGCDVDQPRNLAKSVTVE